MSTDSRQSLIGPILAAVAPLVLYSLLLLRPEMDSVISAPVSHFYITSAAALLAAGLSVAVGIAGVRVRNVQVVSLSIAFTSLALIFALHGLSTPGLILEEHQFRLAGVAAQLSITVLSVWLLISTLPADRRLVPALAGRPALLLTLWTVLLSAVVIAGMLNPGLVAWIPVDRAPLRYVTALGTIILLLAAGVRYWRSWRYSRFPLQRAITYAVGFVVATQVIVSTGTVWNISWWIYHFLLLAAMVGLIVGLVRQYSDNGSVAEAVRSLFVRDARELLERGIVPSVRALVLATEARDSYTAGHNVRVALLAVRLGEALRLPPEQLRALAQGGVIHDVGKVHVPDAILNKSGPLTDEERAIIQEHPVTGYQMCRHLGLMQAEMEVIRSHHERWDGSGYPDRLAGRQIPFLARVLAVADVFDAVTSSRSYRDAWSHDRAHQLIEDEAGRHFDPTCVAAWKTLSHEGLARITEIQGFSSTRSAE
ncbi:MAG: HD-GYP domain-containing protein [Alkalispirochaeta sp.]